MELNNDKGTVVPQVTDDDQATVVPQVAQDGQSTVVPQVAQDDQGTVVTQVSRDDQSTVVPQVTYNDQSMVEPQITLDFKSTIVPQMKHDYRREVVPQVIHAVKNIVVPQVTHDVKSTVVPQVTHDVKSTVEDPIERVIGAFGLYQWIVLALVSLGRFPTEYQLNNVVFVIPGVEYICLDEGANNGTNVCPCENPLYDDTYVVSSVTTEFNLICERGSLASLAQSMLQLGILFGSLIYGYISDRYGRKQAALLAMTVEIAFIVCSAVIPDLWMFMVFRFLIGTSVGGVMLCFYVLIIEMTGKNFRPYICGLQELSLVLGYFTLPIIAYYVRYWRQLLLVTSTPWVVSVALYFLIPESPRWLITRGRKKEAVEILTRIAKRNKRPTDHIEEAVNQMYEESIQNKEQHATYLDLFKTPKIRKYTIIMALVWMCTAFAYFGVNQYIGRLEGNLYLNVMIAASSLFVGLILFVIATLYFKRRISLIISFCSTAISLIVFLFVPYSLYPVYLTFAIIGLMTAYVAFMQIYLYSSEVFPTVVRNSALGVASMFARVGGFVAPFIVNIGIELASILIFSGVAIFAAILCCFLPETKDIVLLNTIDETEHIDKSQNKE